ncbi:uncharacterized protein PRCAT00002318001 [Priceomyces carsonii]|uniref:uncharacterized protein n=1 Tax=Priceomyces carsonii TaxID=28549 RepID=UPI002ED9BD98|nr:unnamed protein product [Priceomyces carsonii]
MPELRSSSRLASKQKSNSNGSSEPPRKKSKLATSTPLKEEKIKKEPSPKEIQLGDSIPDLNLLDEDENEVSLKEAAQKTKYLVIFAYPKASTPGCTRQACGFQKNYDFFHKSDVTVFGLSADKPKSQKNFANKQGLKYPLLSDPERKLITVLGAKKSPLGIKRSHWIFVDGKLKVKKIQIGPEDSIDTAKSDIEKFIAEDSKKDKS